MRAGVAGCIPALNYRTLEELRAACRELKAAKAACGKGAYGFNLIVNKSNPKAAGQLQVLCEEGCDFIRRSSMNVVPRPWWQITRSRLRQIATAAGAAE